MLKRFRKATRPNSDDEAATRPLPEIEDGQVSAEAVRWVMRLFVGRLPASAAELALHRGHVTVESLRQAFAETREFTDYYRHVRKAEYAAPLALLAPPSDPAVPWLFAPPSLSSPVSQLCTQAQIDDPVFARLARELGQEPVAHRKLWEFCYIVSVMRQLGVLQSGRRALGFGVGTEPIPALLAAHGLDVMATDAPAELIQGQGWDNTNQHASGIAALQRPDIVASEVLHQRVSFRPVDMNRIPPDLHDFDVCWSSCALEHLGSIAHGLDFIEASVATLRPGGIEVHTTEFNLSSDTETFESPGLSLFRKRDIEAVAARLLRAGHEVLPLNFHPGLGPVDRHVDLPPYSLPHLKLSLDRFVCTSFGLVVRKRG